MIRHPHLCSRCDEARRRNSDALFGFLGFFFLLAFYLVFGIAYVIWRLTTRRPRACRACGADLTAKKRAGT